MNRRYTTRLLAAETWDDFAALVEANNGVWGGCWCMAFHPEGTSNVSALANRDAKERHVRAGSAHQVLVYDDETCVGWCQFGSTEELPNIKNEKAYRRDASDHPAWRIGCIFTGSRYREQGVARAAVSRTLAEIADAGGGTVEAYPEQTHDRKPQRGAYLQTGPEERALRRLRVHLRPSDSEVALGDAPRRRRSTESGSCCARVPLGLRTW